IASRPQRVGSAAPVGVGAPVLLVGSRRDRGRIVTFPVSLVPVPSVVVIYPQAPTKPLLRGWSHAVAALAAVIGLVVLVFTTRDDPAKLVSMVVYGAGLVLLFGVSATYHIFNWPARVRAWLRRAD